MGLSFPTLRQCSLGGVPRLGPSVTLLLLFRTCADNYESGIYFYEKACPLSYSPLTHTVAITRRDTKLTSTWMKVLRTPSNPLAPEEPTDQILVPCFLVQMNPGRNFSTRVLNFGASYNFRGVAGTETIALNEDFPDIVLADVDLLDSMAPVRPCAVSGLLP